MTLVVILDVLIIILLHFQWDMFGVFLRLGFEIYGVRRRMWRPHYLKVSCRCQAPVYLLGLHPSRTLTSVDDPFGQLSGVQKHKPTFHQTHKLCSADNQICDFKQVNWLRLVWLVGTVPKMVFFLGNCVVYSKIGGL